MWEHPVTSAGHRAQAVSGNLLLQRLQRLSHSGQGAYVNESRSGRRSLFQLLYVDSDSETENRDAVEHCQVEAGLRAIMAHLHQQAEMWAMCSELSLPQLADELTPLLGAGYGLTPSGDDFTGGVLLGLHLAGLSAEARQLCGLMMRVAPQRTHEMSCRLLRAAGEGSTSEPLNVTLTALTGKRELTDGNYQALRATISTYGATSGWDCLAGVYFYSLYLSKLKLFNPGQNKIA